MKKYISIFDIVVITTCICVIALTDVEFNAIYFALGICIGSVIYSLVKWHDEEC